MIDQVLPEYQQEFTLYDSAEELLAAIDTINPSKFEKHGGLSLDDYDFLGRTFTSWADFRSKFTQSWDAGISTIERMLETVSRAVTIKPKSRTRKLQWREDDGAEIDLDRLRGGQLYWRDSRRQLTSGSGIITIVSNNGALSNVDPMDILWRGAAAICLTNILENAGYRVELFSCSHARDVMDVGKDTWIKTIAVNLKRSSDPVDLSTLVNALSGWWFRQAIFRARFKTQGKMQRGRMGYTLTMDERVLDQVTGPVQNRLHIQDCFSEREAISTVQNYLMMLEQ
jgi:hypothetical protein